MCKRILNDMNINSINKLYTPASNSVILDNPAKTQADNPGNRESPCCQCLLWGDWSCEPPAGWRPVTALSLQAWTWHPIKLTLRLITLLIIHASTMHSVDHIPQAWKLCSQQCWEWLFRCKCICLELSGTIMLFLGGKLTCECHSVKFPVWILGFSYWFPIPQKIIPGN